MLGVIIKLYTLSIRPNSKRGFADLAKNLDVEFRLS